ncbi:MAG: glycosyltransferase, partial [Solirubrobacterales bacterium]
GLHYISATVEEMPAAIRYFLTHDRERQAVVTAAYRHVRTDVTEAAATDRILGLIRERLTSDRNLRATACRRTPTATNREPP